MANVPFERERASAHTDAMIAWFLGLSADTAGRVTDLNIGSNIRTLLETVAIRLEHLDAKAFAAMRALIPAVLYEWLGEGDGATTSVGFPALPALPASGVARFTLDPEVLSVMVPAGTRLVAPRVGAALPVTYATTADATLVGSATDIVIQASVAGRASDAMANTLVLLDPVEGIVSATNPTALRGRAAETAEERRLRFVAYLRSLARCQLDGLEVGAATAKLLSAGAVVERVLVARALPAVDARGVVDVFIDNGGGAASADLVAETQRVLDGYLDGTGVRVPGYKAAGILVRVYGVTPQAVPVTVQVRIDPAYRWSDVQAAVQTAVTDYLDGLGVFVDLVWTELTGVIATVPGVVDHQLVTPTANVEAQRGGRLLAGTVTVTPL